MLGNLMEESGSGRCQEKGTCPTCWITSCSQIFVNSQGMAPFLFQHDCTLVDKARSIKPIQTWMDKFGVGELDWPPKIPDLKPTEHLWDELERRV